MQRSPDRQVRNVYVGREDQLRELRTHVDDALRGCGRLILLAGEPGIGKTRTCEELAAYAHEHGARALWGRCYEGDGAPALWPWVQIIRSVLERTDNDQLRTLLMRSGPGIAQVVPEVHMCVPNLPAMSTIDAADSRREVFASVYTLLEGLGQEEPLLVVIDDLQGADQSSALLLQFLAQSCAQAPARFLLLCTVRTAALTLQSPLGEVLRSLVHADGHQYLELGGLTAPDVARLVEVQAGAMPPPGVVAQLHHVTEGNPLFVKEVTRLLVRDERWPEAVAGNAGNIPIPSTVTAVIEKRLATLSAQCRELLAAAAVIGREFTGAVLEDVVVAEPLTLSLTEALQEGLQQQIIACADVSGAYRFTHALIRDTRDYGLQSLSRSGQQRFHRWDGDSAKRPRHSGGEFAHLTPRNGEWRAGIP